MRLPSFRSFYSVMEVMTGKLVTGTLNHKQTNTQPNKIYFNSFYIILFSGVKMCICRDHDWNILGHGGDANCCDVIDSNLPVSAHGHYAFS